MTELPLSRVCRGFAKLGVLAWITGSAAGCGGGSGTPSAAPSPAPAPAQVPVGGLATPARIAVVTASHAG